MNSEAQRLLDKAMDLSHQAVLALERFREGAHAVVTADLVSAAKTPGEIGAIYSAHLRCCWDSDLDGVARARVRELATADYSIVPF